VHGGHDYFSTLLQLIDSAQTAIHLQTYIFDGDETGRLVANALLRAAGRKVQVFILLDGYASQHLPKQIIQEWKAAGIHLICRDMWRKAYWKEGGSKKDQFPWVPGIVPEEECLVRVRRNDWVQGKNEISRSYLEMFRQAGSRIIVLSSYFLPGSILRKQMALAAKRGVVIKIVVGGISDVKISRLAEQFMYGWLFRNKIQIYEYQDTILHGKMAVYDGGWMTNGSYNVNRISAYASVELNMDVRNPAFAASVEQELEEIISKHCVQITEESYFRHTGLFKIFLQRVAYETIRLLFFLFTFYFKQEKESK